MKYQPVLMIFLTVSTYNMNKNDKTNWQTKKLGDVCDIQNGFAFKSKAYVSEGIRNIRIGNVQLGEITDKSPRFLPDAFSAEYKQFLLTKDDILISLTGDVGRVGKIKNGLLPAILNQRVGRFINIKEEINKDFLYKFLNSKIFEELVIKSAFGTAQKNTSTQKIKEIEITYPESLAEQKRIVKTLDELFEKVEKAKKNAENNLQNSKELFESYLQSVFANPRKNWEKKKWGDLCHFVRGPFGGSLKKSIFKKEGYVVYEQKHAIHDHFDQLRYFIDERKFKEMIRFEVKPGDIIMSCSGVTLGKVAIIPNGIKKGIINQALLRLTPKENISVYYLKYWLRSKVFQDIIFKYSGGAAIPNVPSAKILKDILIPIPKIMAEQKVIVKKLDALSVETKKLEAIYAKKVLGLEELKKSVLNSAFNGDL